MGNSGGSGMTRLYDKKFNFHANTRYTQKLGLSIGIVPPFSGHMTVVKVQVDPTERLLLAFVAF
jgi:hypothetical protein